MFIQATAGTSAASCVAVASRSRRRFASRVPERARKGSEQGSRFNPTKVGIRRPSTDYYGTLSCYGSAKTKMLLPVGGWRFSGVRSCGTRLFQLAPPVPTGTARYCLPSTA